MKKIFQPMSQTFSSSNFSPSHDSMLEMMQMLDSMMTGEPLWKSIKHGMNLFMNTTMARAMMSGKNCKHGDVIG